MINTGNKFIKKEKKFDYQNYLNVWVDDTKRLEGIKTLMLTDQNFKLEKLRTNPVFTEVYKEITMERDLILRKLDKSWLWSRKFTPQRFADFIIPFTIYSCILLPYIFYKVLHKRIYEYHVKYGYDAESLKGYGYWNIDFENKDLYPNSVIKLYFEVKKQKFYLEKEKEKAIVYSDQFVQKISNGYLSDFSKRRKKLGFDDDII
jgi:hypothetical protein